MNMCAWIFYHTYFDVQSNIMTVQLPFVCGSVRDSMFASVLRDLCCCRNTGHYCCCCCLSSTLSPVCSLSLPLCICFRQRGEASWGNTTASWLQRSWMTWPRTPNSTRQSSSSGTKASSKTVPPASSTWRSFSSSMLRWAWGGGKGRRHDAEEVETWGLIMQ